MEDFDIAVIGSGPGGYVAAIRSAQLGYKTALIEKYPTLGGTCTNVGCIPTKALLDSTHHYADAIHKFSDHGIQFSNIHLDFGQLHNRKADVVTKNTQGLDFLMRKNKVTVLQGIGSFINNEILNIQKPNSQPLKIKAGKYIIATGSKPSTIPGVSIDKKRIITSTEALNLPEKPNSLIIIGGGVIGVEMASIFNRMGTKVTILEYAENLIPNMDKDLSNTLHKILAKEGIVIRLQEAVYKTENLGDTARIWFKNKQGPEQELTADYILVAVGRKPYTENLGLENTGVILHPNKTIKTNERLQTTVPHIFAIGDVTGGAMLAHKAEEEAVFVVESIHGLPAHINYNRIPSVVYTWPEIAAVGYTEDELKKKGISYNIGKFPFAVNARARAGMETEGFVKVLSDPQYGELLGVHIIGARAADLITQALIGLEFEVTDGGMGAVCYPHPTYSEVLKEAYTIASGKPSINI